MIEVVIHSLSPKTYSYNKAWKKHIIWLRNAQTVLQKKTEFSEFLYKILKNFCKDTGDAVPSYGSNITLS